MIIECFRCGKDIDTPNAKNADYIIAPDTVVRESREVFIALKYNQITRDKKAQLIKDKTETLDTSEKVPPTEDYIRSKFIDSEYDAVEVVDPHEAKRLLGDDMIKVIVEVREKDIQKTGIVCPGCYKPTDTLIWGTHKRTLLGNPNRNH